MLYVVLMETEPVADTDWMEQANCRQNNQPFFGPEYETSLQKRNRERVAKAICAQCQVQVDCLNHALAINETSKSVWGGMNETEREILRLRRGRRGIA